jgi:CBS domain-containing protein
MNASDVMTSPVVTAKTDASVREVVALLLDNRISAVPVVDAKGALVGIVSEGDLMRRAESGTEHRRPWWLRMLMGKDALAIEFVKEHSLKAADLMTRKVITAAPDTPLHEIATLLEKNRVKRVPIVSRGKVVGIVSRANLLRALASVGKGFDRVGTQADAAIRERIEARLRAESWAKPGCVNVIVHDGTVELWGIVDSQAEKKAMLVAAEVTPGVRAVNDNLVVGQMVSGI